MRDDEARFAAELGRSVGRWDWWNLKGEHTQYEWAMQRAMYRVCPYGERRADRRAAFHTAQLLAAWSSEELPEGAFGEMVEALTKYEPCEADHDDDVDLEALKRIRKDS